MNEYVLSLNEYSTPKVIKDRDAICVLLIRLMLLNPGTIQSHPDMGVGIIKNWRYGEMSEILKLEAEIARQIETYLPMFQGVEVKVKQIGPKEIGIDIIINDVLYSFRTDEGNIQINEL